MPQERIHADALDDYSGNQQRCKHNTDSSIFAPDSPSSDCENDFKPNDNHAGILRYDRRYKPSAKYIPTVTSPKSPPLVSWNKWIYNTHRWPEGSSSYIHLR